MSTLSSVRSTRFFSLVRFVLSRLFVLLVACNYVAFRVELFAEEYEHAHPTHAGSASSFTSSSTTWESFDKDNAPKAFYINSEIRFTILGVRVEDRIHSAPEIATTELIRDKSPPLASFNLF